MNFVIADTFTSSLARLTAQEQKAVKTTAFDMQINPAMPGLSFHKLDRARDPNFWSVRVSADLRIIVHRAPASLLLAYVGHHDDAYNWAARRKLERHPTTGAMQLLELVELVEGTASDPLAAEFKRWAIAPDPDEHPQYDRLPMTPSGMFTSISDHALLSYGVPQDWIEPVRAANEDALLDLLTHLPQEAREAILRLAVGEEPIPAEVIAPEADPFTHPDAQRRFRIMTNADELRLALDAPWDKWAVFLHPAQASLTKKRFNGPARVAGSAGTGKTIVAIHRAVALGRKHPSSVVLLTTFTKPLANALRRKLALLVGTDRALGDRIKVDALNAVAYDLHTRSFGQPSIAPPATIKALLQKASDAVPGHRFSPAFLIEEWSEIVDAWQLNNWEAYRDVPRLGRKTRIGEKQREVLWSIFSSVSAKLAERKLVTWPDVFGRLAESCVAGAKPSFDYAVVDECQDLDVAQARFLAAATAGREDALFFAGDLGQRIFQQPFSWKSLGIDVRGRSTTLRINYRTSHQIRMQADRLLPGSISDVDGIKEGRRGTISLFDGPLPTITLFRGADAEKAFVGSWTAQQIADGATPDEIAIFVRSEAEMKRARDAIKAAGCDSFELTDKAEAETGKVAFSTMHLAKGHEFRIVAVMACDEDVLPFSERLNEVGDEAELEAIYETERHLLYVACTRARDRLLISGVEPGSLFLSDLQDGSGASSL